ncbi:arginine--tRNA ligase [Stieleria varia]|uniref:Arginine--tRNA ligase n=1 Tax=Stieleria varia TaxID=2528005 RepID=A0A5C6AEZ2_9BACT|nr:arginine--tRNA ligase [Stieleria varia]TWT98592.1 Arginine--tRNA ligase [Stieleria varia]
MHISQLVKQRLQDALTTCPITASLESLDSYASMVRPTTDPKFGDYQVNCAMPLAKLVGSNPREVAAGLVDALQVADLCKPPEIAGPGFINLTLTDEFLQDQMLRMLADPRCGVPESENPKRIIVDFSSPNVAKPMHVGHIRSTVIGDCLARTLQFLGHQVITDNHLGDWGTQFGIIIYGYKHFGDVAVVRENPVAELSTLYRRVHQLMGYHSAKKSIAKLESEIQALSDEHHSALSAADAADGADAKKKRKAADGLVKKRKAAEAKLEEAREKIDAVEQDAELLALAKQHVDIGQQVLIETSKLHSGDPENLALWNEFLPFCKDEINRVYDRLNVTFDHVLGESFYHPMLQDVVDELKQRGLAKLSDDAVCVFLPEFDAPMIVQKRDGAFLYATTDIATLRYRLTEFNPDEILYVVDTRQGEHFDKLFAVARLIGMDQVKLVHVNFGTVLGDDGKPMKTRSGSLIGLESLLDDAVAAAYKEACDPDRLAKMDPPMDEPERREVADVIGIAAIKYADLGHERTSDYKFNLDKMVALNGNTATYAQYSYARTVGILQKNETDEESVADRMARDRFTITHPAERALSLALLRFEEALQSVYQDYAPNHLVEYVYSLAETFSKFNDQCHVLKAESEAIQTTRLALVTMTKRVLKQALELLGIRVVRRM